MGPGLREAYHGPKAQERIAAIAREAARAARFETFAKIHEELRKTQQRVKGALAKGELASALQEGQAEQNLQSAQHEVATSERHSVPDVARQEIAPGGGQRRDLRERRGAAG
jgi:hypothetical protein